MRRVNITFQVMENEAQTWASAPIVYVLENVPENYNTEREAHVVSVLNNFATVRITPLFLHDPILPRVAAERKPFPYYQGRQFQYWKVEKKPVRMVGLTELTDEQTDMLLQNKELKEKIHDLALLYAKDQISRTIYYRRFIRLINEYL